MRRLLLVLLTVGVLALVSHVFTGSDEPHRERSIRSQTGLRPPIDLLLYARTLFHVLSVGRAVDPAADPRRVALPALLGFLAARD